MADDEKDKAQLPPGFALDQDRWAPPAAAAPPAAPAAAPVAQEKKPFMSKLEEAAKATGYGTGVFGEAASNQSGLNSIRSRFFIARFEVKAMMASAMATRP